MSGTWRSAMRYQCRSPSVPGSRRIRCVASRSRDQHISANARIGTRRPADSRYASCPLMVTVYLRQQGAAQVSHGVSTRIG